MLLLAAGSILLAQRPPQDGARDESRPPENFRGPRSNRPGGDPNAKRENSVSITAEGDSRILKSNGWPDHASGEIANAPAALRKLDRNGDGKLTPDEYLDPGLRGGPPPPR